MGQKLGQKNWCTLQSVSYHRRRFLCATKKCAPICDPLINYGAESGAQIDLVQNEFHLACFGKISAILTKALFNFFQFNNSAKKKLREVLRYLKNHRQFLTKKFKHIFIYQSKSKLALYYQMHVVLIYVNI